MVASTDALDRQTRQSQPANRLHLYDAAGLRSTRSVGVCCILAMVFLLWCSSELFTVEIEVSG